MAIDSSSLVAYGDGTPDSDVDVLVVVDQLTDRELALTPGLGG